MLNKIKEIQYSESIIFRTVFAFCVYLLIVYAAVKMTDYDISRAHLSYFAIIIGVPVFLIVYPFFDSMVQRIKLFRKHKLLMPVILPFGITLFLPLVFTIKEFLQHG